jgi:hypothetical protein
MTIHPSLREYAEIAADLLKAAVNKSCCPHSGIRRASQRPHGDRVELAAPDARLLD